MACLIAATVFLYLAPRIVPAAVIRPGAVAFAAGLAILVAGLVLRGWSIQTLGEYFTFPVMVSADQPVITAARIACCATPVIPGSCWRAPGRPGRRELGRPGRHGPAAAFGLLWRIHVEENALMATLGDRYRAYASKHKRLVPFIW